MKHYYIDPDTNDLLIYEPGKSIRVAQPIPMETPALKAVSQSVVPEVLPSKSYNSIFPETPPASVLEKINQEIEDRKVGKHDKRMSKLVRAQIAKLKNEGRNSLNIASIVGFPLEKVNKAIVEMTGTGEIKVGPEESKISGVSIPQ